MPLNHMGTESIETLRLQLRKFELSDASDMFNHWAGDAEVCKYLSWGPHPSEDISSKRIANWVNHYSYNNSYVWAIVWKNKGTVIGSISVEFSDDYTQSCEVGYCLGKAYWNRGIMTEALHAVMHYLFYEIGYREIKAKHDVLNLASGKVMQKAGMNFIKYEYRTGIRKDGSIYDCAVYAKQKTND